MDDGQLVYEYNMMIIENYKARTEKIPAGKHQIVIDTDDRQAGRRRPKWSSPSTATKRHGRRSQRTVPAAFTATESFDIGVDLGSTVSLAYEDKRPFAFDGKIEQVKVSQQ